MHVRLLVLALLIACAFGAAAQDELAPPVEPRQENPLQPSNLHPAVPAVSFEWTSIGAAPQRFSLTVESTGRAALSITDTSGPDATPAGDPYQVRFLMSAENRRKVFQLAEQANFFRGDFEYRKTRIANTGSKTLTYADADKHYSTTFNWSQNKALQDITKLFQGVYWTHYYARRLQQLRRFDKLGLEATLKIMEDAAHNGDLAEVHTIEPLLKQIAEDGSVMQIARARARRLLAKAAAEGASSEAAAR